MKKLLPRILSLAAFMFAALPASAQEIAHPDQLGFQHPASAQMERLVDFHNLLLWIITAITIFVMGLMLWVIIRYNAKANPTPSRTTHNVLLEIVWTVVPVIILIVIAVPSFKLLYYLDRTPETEMTLKVTGYQWYWGYEYPDQGNIAFESRMLTDKEIDETKGQRRLLSVDNAVVLPVDTDIQIDVTASDVLHAFAVPALGIKKDAVSGRLNTTWVRITKPGTYFGQCSEICGTGHAYMPIEIRAVSKEEFAVWVEEAKKQFAENGYQPIQLAQSLEGVE